MARYPTNKEGLIISPYELGYTETPRIKGRTSNHHGNYPKSAYQRLRYQHVFRNLVSNLYPMLIEQHYNLHYRFQPPRKPQDDKMIEVVQNYLDVNGVIDVVREKHTNDVYQIQADEWDIIKGAYRGIHSRGRVPKNKR